jgi:two-component system, LytTR family, sensor kinase
MRNKLLSRHYSIYVKALINQPVLFHLLIWVMVFVILSLLTSLNGIWPISFYLMNTLVALPPMIIFSYTMEWLGNQLLLKAKKFLVFILFFILITGICSLLIPVMNHLFFFGIFFPRVFESTPWFNWRQVPQNLILLWFPFLFISLKTLFVNWFKAEQEKLIIENRRLSAEIQLMKIKLHPHFLFNTLNNLYAMAKANCENTSDYIMKLSEIYRIMLYECNKDFYPVNEEIRLIRNYIELEKIRYDERLNLKIEIPDSVDPDLMIPPLLLFTFVENSFKHGCRNDVGNPFIEIEVAISSDFLEYHSLNSIPENGLSSNQSGGIGLENTRQRLKLIYENEYLYSGLLNGNLYEVILKIPNLYAS